MQSTRKNVTMRGLTPEMTPETDPRDVTMRGLTPEMQTELQHIFSINQPRFYFGLGEPSRKEWIPSYFYNNNSSDACVRLLRGNKMRNQQGLMDEFAASYQFFLGFGENWQALEECLCYLDEWLPASAYILVIEIAELILEDAPVEDLRMFLKVLYNVSDFWAKPIHDNGRFNRPAIPFHVLFHFSNADSYIACHRLVDMATLLGISILKDHGMAADK